MSAPFDESLQSSFDPSREDQSSKHMPVHYNDLIKAHNIHKCLPDKVISTGIDCPKKCNELKCKTEQFLKKSHPDKSKFLKKAAIGLTIGVALLPLTVTAWLGEAASAEMTQLLTIFNELEDSKSDSVKWAKLFSFLPSISMLIGLDAYHNLFDDKKQE